MVVGGGRYDRLPEFRDRDERPGARLLRGFEERDVSGEARGPARRGPARTRNRRRRTRTRNRRGRTVRVAAPLLIPLALALTLGVILAVSSSSQPTHVQQSTTGTSTTGTRAP